MDVVDAITELRRRVESLETKAEKRRNERREWHKAIKPAQHFAKERNTYQKLLRACLRVAYGADALKRGPFELATELMNDAASLGELMPTQQTIAKKIADAAGVELEAADAGL